MDAFRQATTIRTGLHERTDNNFGLVRIELIATRTI